MTGSKTAAIEALTAEVRVLMVGSRQVTMSVYNQFDYVRPDQIEPFGRVNPKDGSGKHIYVAGRHIETRALVYSYTCAEEISFRSFAVIKLKTELGLSMCTSIPDDQIEAETARIAALAAEWSQLPLIILAD